MKKITDILNFKKIHSGVACNVNPPSAYGADIITVKNLTKSFMGIKAIDDLTVNIPQAMTIGLIGSNGSGKTTLINILTGMLHPDTGEITVRDKKRTHIKSNELRKYGIARTFQDGRLIEQMSVVDNLLLPVAENSLIEIGRVLMQDADIYFFDEPFSGLFPEIVEQVCEIICGLQRQGKTIVIIEHNMSLIRRLCDHIIVLNHGKLLAEGKPEDVLQNKAVQESYLGV